MPRSLRGRPAASAPSPHALPGRSVARLHVPRPANPLVRENLLDAGLTLFHARGFNAVGIKEVTDTAGVPKGSFLLVAVRQPPAIAWMDFRSTGALVGLC
ncbi:helix-turn-helix transcriptional regulator [Streptomyces lunaelactis]|nr:helix-turn-helix transcriptional regulator [Streptomyces lunaelactis]NUK51096.1 helix-turn-helix transcriptional regulator [Streptomyces lunaelactis]NUK64721.1 helix-turn-helix transcriptional regulator [Streptomyces lunaelactis]NUK77808.1 helix-turn-helix transcriptional regulator [Streptomyces lunaelactis]